MNPFLCVLDLTGANVGGEALTAALPGLSQGEGRVDAVFDGCWAGALVPSAVFGRPAIVRRRGIVAIGSVRLHNRNEIAGRGSMAANAADDLALVIDQYLRRGAPGIRDLIGDFAFVLWDSQQQRLLAARDALGVKSLFYQQQGRRLIIASHSDLLEQGEYDRDFLAHFLIGFPSPTSHTVFQNVMRLPAGTLLQARDGRLTTETFWSPHEFAPAVTAPDPQRAQEEFRDLFTRAVAAQFDDGKSTWSQLSGGLDSSAIVGMAAALAGSGRVPRGLDGTLTVVDSLSEGDETRYSNAVLTRTGLPNSKVTDYGAWQSDEFGLPTRAEPEIFLPFYARNREMCRVVKDGGGQVLLSGLGPDHYLAGTFDFIADLLAQGQVRKAGRQLTNLAVATRQSFWKLGYQHGLRSFAPRWLQRRWAADASRVPAWFTPEFSRESNLADRQLRFDRPRSGNGVFADLLSNEVATIDLFIERGVFEDGIEMRYPFLYRPLVEFGLSLPATMRAVPHQSKWILRESLGSVLPEEVRTRSGKGGIDGRVTWSLNRERPLLDRLIRDSHLAELGCVRRSDLASALANACTGAVSTGLLFVTLALETWLAVRSGWWSRNTVGSTMRERHVTRITTSEEMDHVYETAIR